MARQWSNALRINSPKSEFAFLGVKGCLETISGLNALGQADRHSQPAFLIHFYQHSGTIPHVALSVQKNPIKTTVGKFDATLMMFAEGVHEFAPVWSDTRNLSQ